MRLTLAPGLLTLALALFALPTTACGDSEETDADGDTGTGASRTIKAAGGDTGWAIYDASENPYRLEDGGGWRGESADGCATDKFTTWLEWDCDPGELRGTIVRFWADDTIPKDDPDYSFGDHTIYINESDETVSIGMQMLSTEPVVLSSVDFHVRFPAELLEFTKIERHWASIKRDEPPSTHTNVEVVEPGLLKFTWWMADLPRVIHKGDIPLASVHFNILKAGEGDLIYPRPKDETWDQYQPPFKWHLKSEVTDERPVWATMVDGTEGPVHWLWNSKLVIR